MAKCPSWKRTSCRFNFSKFCLTNHILCYDENVIMNNIHICRKCGSQNNTRYGKRQGKQCYRCKNCGFEFTEETKGHAKNYVFEIMTNKYGTILILAIIIITIAVGLLVYFLVANSTTEIYVMSYDRETRFSLGRTRVDSFSHD